MKENYLAYLKVKCYGWGLKYLQLYDRKILTETRKRLYIARSAPRGFGSFKESALLENKTIKS